VVMIALLPHLLRAATAHRRPSMAINMLHVEAWRVMGRTPQQMGVGAPALCPGVLCAIER